jgi:cytidylate kinase
MIVTIDGPVASGKTSVAQAVAQKLSWFCILSGYLYRAVTYALMQRYPHDDFHQRIVTEDDMLAILQTLVYQVDAQVKVTISYQGRDITSYLKEPVIDQNVTLLSKQYVVRLHLVDVQRRLVLHRNTIVEGRDCGTVVFPDAACKIFLTADPVVRAQRWQADQARRGGVHMSLDECVRFITERDARDETRELSPLKISSDSWVFDTSTCSFEEVVISIIEELRARGITAKV